MTKRLYMLWDQDHQQYREVICTDELFAHELRNKHKAVGKEVTVHEWSDYDDEGVYILTDTGDHD